MEVKGPPLFLKNSAKKFFSRHFFHGHSGPPTPNRFSKPSVAHSFPNREKETLSLGQRRPQRLKNWVWGRIGPWNTCLHDRPPPTLLVKHIVRSGTSSQRKKSQKGTTTAHSRSSRKEEKIQPDSAQPFAHQLQSFRTIRGQAGRKKKIQPDHAQPLAHQLRASGQGTHKQEGRKKFNRALLSHLPITSNFPLFITFFTLQLLLLYIPFSLQVRVWTTLGQYLIYDKN